MLADAGAIYIYIYIYIYTYTYTCMHTYIHTYIHTCIHTYRHTFIHTYIHTYIHTHRCSCPGIPAYMSRYSAPECRCCLPRISNYTRPIFHDRAKTARKVTAPTISRKSGRVRGQRMQEIVSHGLCPHVMIRNAGPVCQEYQTTLAQSSMIGKTARNVTEPTILCQSGRTRRRRVH